MSSFKLFVDILSSLAAFVAIVTVLTSWWFSRLPAIKITQMVISRKNDKYKIFVRIRNQKQYPIKINSINCYKERRYSVTKNKNEKPTLFPSVNIEDNVFSHGGIELTEHGELTFEVISDESDLDRNKFFFSILTTHGRMDVICNNVNYFEQAIRTVKPSAIYYDQNKVRAVLVYVYKYIHYIRELALQRLKR